MITRHTVDIAVAPDPVSGLPERIVFASPLHIARVEQDLPTAGD